MQTVDAWASPFPLFRSLIVFHSWRLQSWLSALSTQPVEQAGIIRKKKRGGYFTHFTVLHDLKSFRNAEGRVWLLGQDNKYVQRRKKKNTQKKLSLCVCHHRATFQEYFSLWRHDWLPEVSGSGTTPCHFFFVPRNRTVTELQNIAILRQ